MVSKPSSLSFVLRYSPLPLPVALLPSALAELPLPVPVTDPTVEPTTEPTLERMSDGTGAGAATAFGAGIAAAEERRAEPRSARMVAARILAVLLRFDCFRPLVSRRMSLGYSRGNGRNQCIWD